MKILFITFVLLLSMTTVSMAQVVSREPAHSDVDNRATNYMFGNSHNRMLESAGFSHTVSKSDLAARLQSSGLIPITLRQYADALLSNPNPNVRARGFLINTANVWFDGCVGTNAIENYCSTHSEWTTEDFNTYLFYQGNLITLIESCIDEMQSMGLNAPNF